MLEADVEVDRRDFAVRACLRVAPGERLALFGPSGAGKTTLLEVIAGLVIPTRARITLAGRVLTATARPVTAVPPWRRRVGLLRQDPGLFPHLSVRDNLRYARSRPGSAPRARRRAGPDADAEIGQLAAALGIDGLLAAMPAQLSGGQAHRVALGRLLASHCDALLLDEPYTGLDASLRRTLTDLVIALVAQRRIPAILVAHELAEAQAFADRLAVLDHGTVLQIGAPADVVLAPATRRVAELVGYTAFVPAPGPESPTGPAPGHGPGRWPGAGGGPGAEDGLGTRGGPGMGPAGTVAAVHPDRVAGGSHPDRGLVLTGVVTACRPAEARWEVSLATAGVVVTGRLAEPAPVGQELTLTVVGPPWFGPDGSAIAVPGEAAVPGGTGASGRAAASGGAGPAPGGPAASGGAGPAPGAAAASAAAAGRGQASR